MKHGFADEAGDAGRAKGSARYLVIAVVLTDDPQQLRRIVAQVRKGLGKKLKTKNWLSLGEVREIRNAHRRGDMRFVQTVSLQYA